MSVASWKMGAVWLCVLVSSLAAASVMYDDMPPPDMKLVYQEHNYIDMDPQPSVPELSDGHARDLLWYKTLTSLRNGVVSPNVPAGPRLSSETGLEAPETFEYPLLKGAVMKRNSEANGAANFKGTTKPPGQKWKIKKERVGSYMVCYFKLCAFRPPM